MLNPSLITVAPALAGRFDIDVLPVCDSTNSELLQRAEAGAVSGTVLVAEQQTAGRGRQGRTWFAAPGDSLTFSLLWRFAPGTAPAGLSLAVGVAVARALASQGVEAQLKWPNDVLRAGRKLGGILVELVPGAPHAAVIGIGLNLRLPPTLPEEVRALAIALDTGVAPEHVLGAVLSELATVLVQFEAGGFAELCEAWAGFDAWRDRPAQLLSDFEPPRHGICRGVETSGALRFEEQGKMHSIIAGEISLRAEG
jgi:BirA family biotin operon repressor/biotin-[acetyl-CoA-carboxylase] ligase